MLVLLILFVARKFERLYNGYISPKTPLPMPDMFSSKANALGPHRRWLWPNEKDSMAVTWNFPFIEQTCILWVMRLSLTSWLMNHLILEDLRACVTFLLVSFSINELILLNVRSNYTTISLGWKTTAMGLLQREHISSYTLCIARFPYKSCFI